MFKFKKSKKTGKDKEISLVVESTSPQEQFVMKVDRSALLKNSAVFKKMDENGEFKKLKEVKMKGITVNALQKIIQYIKSESVFFQNHFEAIETLKAAYIYQVHAMKDICANFLITAIKAENVCDIYEFASSYEFPHVEYHCLKFIDLHSGDVLKTSGFLTLKKTALTDIIKRQSLNVPSEIVVFRAILTWGFNDCLRRGVEAENADEVLKSVKSLLGYVKFLTLTEEEMSDPHVDKFHKILCSEGSESKRRSLLNLEANRRSVSVDSWSTQSREYAPNYAYDLEMVETDDHAVKNGETFCLRVESLKGRVFLTAVTLAFERFVNSKNASCLYVALSATNVKTAEQVCARGAFMSSSEEAEVKFPLPLVVKESENVEIALKVKRAVNICSMIIKSDSQIILPDRNNLALKIVPFMTTGGTERSLFLGLKYFF